MESQRSSGIDRFMFELIKDPKVFNYVILALYACNIVRWTIAGSRGDALYWAGAFWITASVTWGYKHG